MKWLLLASLLLVGCDKKAADPAKATASGSGSAATMGSGAALAAGSGAGMAAPVAEAPVVADAATAALPATPPATGGAFAPCGDPACAVATMKAIRDQMCKCAEKECAMRLTEAMTAWATESSGKFNDVKPDEAMMKDMEQVGKELGECTTKAMMAGMDTAPSGDLSLTPPSAGFHKKRTTPIGKPPGKKPACLTTGKMDSTQCALDSMAYFTDKMCACPDKTCGEGLVTEMTTWAQEAAKSAANTTPTEADLKRMEELGKRLGECTQDVMLTDPTAP